MWIMWIEVSIILFYYFPVPNINTVKIFYSSLSCLKCALLTKISKYKLLYLGYGQ